MSRKYTDIQPFATMNPSCPLGNMNWTSFNWLGAEPHRARNPFTKQGKPPTYGGIDVWCGDKAEEKYWNSPNYFGDFVNQDYFAPYEYGQGPYTKDYYNSSNTYHSQTIQIVNPNGSNGVLPLPIKGFTATLFNPGFGSNFSSDCRWVKVWGHYTKASNGYTYSWEMSSNQYTLRNTFDRTELALDKSPHEMGENEFRNVCFIVEDPVNRNKIGTEDYYMTGISISTWMGRQAGMQKYNGHSLFNLMPSIHENFWKATGHNLPGWINGLQRTDSTMIMPALHSIHTLGQNQWWAHNEITKFAEGSVWDLQSESTRQASGKYSQAVSYY